jgi:hypothetical protein
MVPEFAHLSKPYVRIPFLHAEMISWKEKMSTMKGQNFHVTKVETETGGILACECWHLAQLSTVKPFSCSKCISHKVPDVFFPALLQNLVLFSILPFFLDI